MFDVGFSEIVVIAVVALIVIGPERLPKTARMLGHMLGRLQRYVNEVKADINREMELEELRKLKNEVKTAATEIEQSMHSAAKEFDAGVRNVEQQLNDGASESAPRGETGMQAVAAPPADAVAQPESPRQPELPGFDKI
jgi:sec-independent protein translocase protein TatB